MSETEEWRPVAGWVGLYEVSSLGRVRSLDRIVETAATPDRRAYSRKYRSRILAPTPRHGYPFVVLMSQDARRDVAVHILVAETFLGARPPDYVVAHNDGNKANGRLTNLRWATRVENEADKLKHGTRNAGMRHGNAKYAPETIQFVRDNRHFSPDEISARFGMSPGYVKLLRCPAGQNRRSNPDFP